MRVRLPYPPGAPVAGLACGLLIGVGAGGAALGQPPPPPPPPKNLQFFPKDIPRPELIQTMRQFSFALGVRCEHCHVDEETGDNPRQDFASDEKRTKVKARAMLQMTKQLNQDLLAKIPDRSKPPVTVGCATCHHGLAKPETLSGRLHAAVAAAGADSAVAELRRLRQEAEFGRFDVSEWGVNEAARAFSSEDKNDEALALLRANAEFHPDSHAILGLMAEVQVARGDKAAAIETLRKQLAADPENRRAKRMLEQLESAPKDAKH